MKGRELKVDQKLKKRIEEGYSAISKAMAEGKDTTEWEKQVVRLEKRLIEEALGVTLTAEELQYVKTISTIKSVFLGAKVIEVSSKKKR
ncbi:MAG: hypothetical protein ACM3SR_18250 [Ignavibacteriales bacterium]